MRMVRLMPFFASWIALLLLLSAAPATRGLSFKIQVCQNKDCCRQWKHPQNLPETLQDLLPPDAAPVEVEITGCLSQCGKGPNLVLHNSGASSSQLVQGVVGPLQLADELQDYMGIHVPSKLVAAATVMEKATRASAFDEKDRFLSSVIQVLQNDPLLRKSTANMRAHVMHAQIRYEYGMLEEALRDLSEAIDITNNNTNRVLVGLAWRARADCYRALGQIGEAEEALWQWAKHDPSRKTKVIKEIQEMREQ
eukprot:scaffold34603_cov212-Amphora_coffeaeformis.AAC.9